VVLWVLSIESLPQRRPAGVVVAQHRPCIVELVRDRTQRRVLAAPRQMIDVLSLALEPRRLRFLVGVAALLDDARNLVAEVPLDLIARRRAALILERVY